MTYKCMFFTVGLGNYNSININNRLSQTKYYPFYQFSQTFEIGLLINLGVKNSQTHRLKILKFRIELFLLKLEISLKRLVSFCFNIIFEAFNNLIYCVF